MRWLILLQWYFNASLNVVAIVAVVTSLTSEVIAAVALVVVVVIVACYDAFDAADAEFVLLVVNVSAKVVLGAGYWGASQIQLWTE